jgi:hypothetical protein
MIFTDTLFLFFFLLFSLSLLSFSRSLSFSVSLSSSFSLSVLPVIYIYNNNNYARIIFLCSLNIFLLYDILYKTFYNVFSVYICDSCRFSLLSFSRSFLPLLFLSQCLVFVAVVFIILVILSHDNSYLSME